MSDVQQQLQQDGKAVEPTPVRPQESGMQQQAQLPVYTDLHIAQMTRKSDLSLN